MTYSRHHPVRLVGGRLALDFLNTADWTESGAVAHEKIGSLADLRVWLRAVGLPHASCPRTLEEVIAFRRGLRAVFLDGHRADGEGLRLERYLRRIALDRADLSASAYKQPVLALVAASAIAILADPREHGRLKVCPGTDCGWLFIDETKNGRRKWCSMESCGNRAKASRHYARHKATLGG